MDKLIEQLDLPPQSQEAMACARDRWNAVAKPVGSLGVFEDLVVKVAGLTGSADVDLSRRCVCVLCADNGVVAQGVSQSGSEVTATVAAAIANGTSSVCALCAPAGIDCLAVDVGMACPDRLPGVLDRRIAAGTHDITTGPAMTRGQAVLAIRAGIDLVGELASQGYAAIGVGEMGIGNTTTATAVACTLLGRDPADMVGRGAGLSDAGLKRKERVIRQALLVNQPDPEDVVDVLAKVGGFDLAGMCGMFLGGAHHRIPVVVDGLISSVAALAAVRLRPACVAAILPSHLSSEPGARDIMDELGLRPPLRAGMHLGEGTGAAMVLSLLPMAVSLYRGTTFLQHGMQPYEVNPS